MNLAKKYIETADSNRTGTNLRLFFVLMVDFCGKNIYSMYSSTLLKTNNIRQVNWLENVASS